MLNVLLAPWLTVIVPEGEIVPPVPAEAVMVYVVARNTAEAVDCHCSDAFTVNYHTGDGIA